MNVNQEREVRSLMDQASELAGKPTLSKQEERKYSLLLSKISFVKSGGSLTEFDQAELHRSEDELGLEHTQFGTPSFMPAEKRAEASTWQRACRSYRDTGAIRLESRDMTVGNGTPAYLTGNLGSFVPLLFYKQVFAAMKSADALLDEDVVTYISDVDGQSLSQTGRPIEVPMYGDTENVAALCSEAAGSSEVDIHSPSAIMLSGFMFRSPVFHFSMEALQDVEAMGGVVEVFKQFSTDRIRRGVSPYLVTGNGTNQPTGLVSALETLGSAAVTAVGSSGNTGTGETGTTSVGSADIANLFYALNSMYRDSPKCCWLMNSATLGALAAIVTKMGLPIVHWQGPEAYILGKRVRICPSMSNSGSGNIPIVFGDTSFYGVRATACSVKLYKELPGLVENGKFGLRAHCRYDGQLLFNDTSSPAPMVYLQNHS